MEIKEDKMETFRKYAKAKLDIERSENENVLMREINELIFALKENSGKKTIVEALSEFLEKKIAIFAGRFEKVKSMLDAASNALLEKSRGCLATDYDRNTNTLANLPVGSLFNEADKKRNDEFLEKFFDNGKDIEGFDKMTDSDKAIAILKKEEESLKNEKNIEKFEKELKKSSVKGNTKNGKTSKKEKK